MGGTVVPLGVGFDTEVYCDGINLTAEQFYDRLRHSARPYRLLRCPYLLLEVR